MKMMKSRFAAGSTALCLAGVLAFGGTPTQGGGPPTQDDGTTGQDEAPPERIEPGTICTECHQDVADKAIVHRPVRWNNCQLCHVQADPELHAFTPPESMGAVCAECHVMPKRHSMHAPVRDGDCLPCHVPHQSDDRFMLRYSTEIELCGQCHEDQVGKDKEFLHGPAAVGACSLCHFSHSSNEPKLLRKSGTEACLECHVDMQDMFSGALTVHTPVSQDCALCHDAHASDHRYQLKAAPKALCMDCHQPMIDELKAKPIFHEALNNEEGCAYCHEAHSSPYPSMLKRPVRDLCMSCHSAAIEREDGSALPGMGKVIDESTHLHGPIKEGNCSACHDPHGSVTFSLLRDPYPKSFYAPYKQESYALCFRCHDVGAFAVSTTEALTSFRDGDRNLHFLHVNDVKKGRTCRACHETHGSDLPKHMTKVVAFGTWELPVNFVMTPTGGSCAPGCHEAHAYDRITPAGGETPPAEKLSTNPISAR